MVSIDRNTGLVNGVWVGDSPVYRYRRVKQSLELWIRPDMVAFEWDSGRLQSLFSSLDLLSPESAAIPGIEVPPPYAEDVIASIKEFGKKCHGGIDTIQSFMHLRHGLGKIMPPAIPEFSFKMEGGDLLLLTSDGMSLPADRLKNIFRECDRLNSPLSYMIRWIVEECDSFKGDNVTVLAYDTRRDRTNLSA